MFKKKLTNYARTRKCPVHQCKNCSEVFDPEEEKHFNYQIGYDDGHKAGWEERGELDKKKSK